MLLQWSPDSSSKLGNILHVFRNIPHAKDIFISAHKGTDTIRFISSGTLINRPSALVGIKFLSEIIWDYEIFWF